MHARHCNIFPCSLYISKYYIRNMYVYIGIYLCGYCCFFFNFERFDCVASSSVQGVPGVFDKRNDLCSIQCFSYFKKKKFLINSIMLRFDNNVLNSFFFFLLLSFTPSRTQFFENFCAQCTLIFFNISKFVSIRITLYYCIKMTSTNKDKSHSIIMVTQLICKQTV